MRLPHYLTLAPSGVFHFRLRLPAAQRAARGLREVRLSLGTRDRRTAQIAALALAQRYAQALSTPAKGQDMPTREEIIAQALAAAESGRLMEKYKIDLPGIQVEVNNRREHKEVVDMLQALPRALAPVAAVPTPPAQTLTLRDALRRWESALPAELPAKTRSIMRTAVRSMVETLGASRDLPSITRADVALWLEGLQRTGLATPTLANKQTYAKRFFAWAQGAGLYAAGDNPAQGQVRFGAREKRHRRALGWRALTLDEVRALYSPDSLARVPSLAVRWGVLLGLYTGARVSEIAQLCAHVDFIEQDGVHCIRITDEGKGQSLKTDASRRVVPLHPDLIALGILDRLAALRGMPGPDRLAFLTGQPVRNNAALVNGAGDWLSKSFTRWLGKSAILTDAEKGRVGFHSLRKTVVQTLQAAGVAAEIRAAIVGHELDDEHYAAYSTRSPTKAAAEALAKGLTYGLDICAIRSFLF